MIRFAFPDSCPFCGHERVGEGICKCPEDCPSCHQGCCGQIVIAWLPVVPADPQAVTMEA